MSGEGKEYLFSGELAKLSGVSADTIRYYERRGLLKKPQRSRNGYRRYPAESLARVRVIRAALAVGFTVAELSRIFRVRDHGGTPCHTVQQIGRKKLEQIEAQIENLNRSRNALILCLKEWDRALTGTSHGDRARLLEMLPGNTPAAETNRSPLLPLHLTRHKKEKSNK